MAPEIKRYVIIGNSGSGKSTLAQRLSVQHDLPILELDTIVWEQGKIAVERPLHNAVADLQRFVEANEGWVIEGCYAELVERLVSYRPFLYFLNPGAQVCRANNQHRAWEPHKYATAEAQEAMLAVLLEWVDGYYSRKDSWSLSCHRRLFDAYSGMKAEINEPNPP